MLWYYHELNLRVSSLSTMARNNSSLGSDDTLFTQEQLESIEQVCFTTADKSIGKHSVNKCSSHSRQTYWILYLNTN